MSLGWPAEAVLAAALLGAALALGAACWPRRPSLEEWLERRSQRRLHRSRSRVPRSRAALQRTAGWLARQLPAGLRSALGLTLVRAGIGTAPETVLARCLLGMVLAAAAATALGAAGLAPPSLLLLAVALVPLGTAAGLLRRAGLRRRSVSDQLPILVDLMALEQGGGGVGARSAMEAVVTRLDGDAARLLRSCLTQSAAAGTPGLDLQLERTADELAIPALAALGAVVRIQRQEGVATASPLGQLARGLRDQQRDELLARGRRALVTMLLPVALCILLPFILIILYPALARLSAAFS